MNQHISSEQGDINAGDLRQEYVNALYEQTKYWINEDARYFLHQALSTPVLDKKKKQKNQGCE